MRILAQILRRAGYIVETAQTLGEARSRLEKCEVLISDIGLPDGNGYDVIAHAKQKQPVTGVALTGFDKQEDIERSKQAGFDFHLTKPVDPAQLRALLQEQPEH